MIAEIRTVCKLKTDVIVPDDMKSQEGKAFLEKLSGMRKEIVKGIDGKVSGKGIHAPAYFALFRDYDEGDIRIYFVDFVANDEVDFSLLREYKRLVRSVFQNNSELSFVSISSNAFEGSLRDFHSLNDLIDEEIAELREVPGYMGYTNDLLNCNMNETKVTSSCSYLLVSHNERVDIPDWQGDEDDEEVLDELKARLAKVRVAFKEVIIEKLEEKNSLEYFPGSFIISADTDDAYAVARFSDLFAYPEGMERNEAEDLIQNAFVLVSKSIGDNAFLSYPVFSETDVKADNPGEFALAMTDIAKAVDEKKQKLESDKFPYIKEER